MDIDVLTTPIGQRVFRQIIEDACEESNWSLILETEKDFRISHFVVADLESDGPIPVLPLDVMSIIGWHGVTVLTSQDILPYSEDRQGVMVAPPDVAAAVVLVNSLLFVGSVSKDEYIEQINREVNGESQRFRHLLRSAFGQSAADELLNMIVLHGASVVQRWQSAARRSASRRALRHPLTKIADQFHRIRFGIGRIVSPPGAFLCLLGVDGSGKSTVAELVSERLEQSFSPVLQLHLRPRWLPELRQLAFWRNGGSQRSATRSSGEPRKFGSFVRWSYYWFDYLIGYQVKIRPTLTKKGVVISDRYFHDFRFDHDQKMVRLPDALMSATQRFLPQPDAVVHIRVSSDVATKRRPGEIDKEDTERQLQRIDRIVSKLDNGHIVLNSGSPEEVADHAIRHLFRELANKAS